MPTVFIMVAYGRHHICYIKLIPTFMGTPMIGERLRDVIALEYTAHAFDDCWKLSLNILYFCSKSSKKLDFIGNIYDNIKSSSEEGCRLIQNKIWRWQHISIQHNILHMKARSLFSPVNSNCFEMTDIALKFLFCVIHVSISVYVLD